MCTLMLALMVLALMPHVEPVRVKDDTLRYVSWGLFGTAVAVMPTDPKVGTLLAGALILFLVGHKFYRPASDGFKVAKESFGLDRGDVVTKMKSLKKLSSELGCDVMWLFKQALLEWVDGNAFESQNGELVVDCMLLNDDRKIFEKQKYKDQIMKGLDSLGIGGAKAENYTLAVQTTLKEILMLVELTCPENKEISVKDAKAMIEDMYQVFCVEGDRADRVTDWKEYSVDGNRFPFPITKI